MSNSLLSPSLTLGLVAAIAPASVAPGTVRTGWIDLQDNFTLLAILSLGVLGAGATVDAKIEQATSAAGAGAKDVPGLATRQLTKAADDGKQALINLRQEVLDREGGFRFIRLSVTVAGAASQLSATVLCTNRRHGDASAGAVSTIAQIVGR